METLRFRVAPERLQEPEAQQALEQAAAILRDGGTVALPTETVYGLGANALDATAVAKIFEAKGRPGWDPLIVHVCDAAMVDAIVTEVPEAARKLMEAFWPGPLTLLLPRSAAVPDAVTAGRTLVGVRMPAHRVAQELIRRAGVPIAAPSANRFGHTSPTTAEHVLEDLDGRIGAVVDAGPTAVGVESTVVDTMASPMVIYRPGAITLEQIGAVAGPVVLFKEVDGLVTTPREVMPSPGVGLRHYAPNARLVLVEEAGELSSSIRREILSESEGRVGVMLPDAFGAEIEALRAEGMTFDAYPWGRWPKADENAAELAHRLFAGMRYLDAMGCAVIVCPVPPEQGIGAAIRDRLRKAAAKAETA